MKNLVLIAALLSLVGCGYSSQKNEMVGQVKKLVTQTPII